MSTQGREADALWYEKRAAEMRATGRELDARRYEKLAAETKAFLEVEQEKPLPWLRRAGLTFQPILKGIMR